MAFLLSRDDAYDLTKPFHEVWEEAHRSTWAMWQERLEEDPMWFKPFTAGDRYLMLHRHICDFAARHLDGQVQHAPSLDFFAQIIGEKALIRFKHFDEDYRSRNYPTDQQEHLDKQEFTDRMQAQLALDGIAAPLTVLTVGYTLTPGEDALGFIGITCRTPYLRYWYPIVGNAGAASGDGIDGADGGGTAPSFPGMEPPGPRIISTRPRKKTDGEEV